MKFLLSCILGILLCYQATEVSGWMTHWRRDIRFACKDGDMLTRLTSVHSNRYEDRRWKFGCEGVSDYVQCYWSYFANHYDRPINHRCPFDGYLAGVYSKYHSGTRDRIWKFRCCIEPGVEPYSHCKQTGYVNAWDGKMDYRVPGDYYLAGVYSVHNNHREDRRWRFTICY